MNSLKNLEVKLNNKFNEINNSQADINEENRDYSDLYEMIDLEIERLGEVERDRFYYPNTPEYLVYDNKEKTMLIVKDNMKNRYVTILKNTDYSDQVLNKLIKEVSFYAEKTAQLYRK